MVHVEYTGYATASPVWITYTTTAESSLAWVNNETHWHIPSSTGPRLYDPEKIKQAHRNGMRVITAKQRRNPISMRPRQQVRAKPKIVQQPIGRR